MGTIEINAEPIEVVIEGTTILFQGDPSASAAWDTLMEIEVVFNDPEKRQSGHKQMLEALCLLTETPDDAEQLTKLDLGTATLRKVAMAYAREVTAFPTQPPPRSTTRSKKTGGN